MMVALTVMQMAVQRVAGSVRLRVDQWASWKAKKEVREVRGVREWGERCERDVREARGVREAGGT